MRRLRRGLLHGGKARGADESADGPHLPACAECCDACYAECEKLNDPEMKEVLDSLKKCAAICREMVKVMGGQAHAR